MSQGRYAVARDYFERALLYTPNYPTLEINLGVDYNAMGQEAVADRHFERAIQLAPGDDEAYFYYGRALLEDGLLQEALPELETAFRLNPTRPPTRTLLMQAYADNGDLPSARRIAEETLALIPGDPEATAFLENPRKPAADYWLNVSLRQYREGDYAGSLASARRSLAVEPNYALALNNVGAAYAGLGQWDLAVEAEQAALRMQPDLAVARNNLAAYLKLQAAAKTAPGPKTADEFLSASLRLYQAGRYPESIAAAESALRLRPNYAEAWNNIAAGYSSMGQWDKAIRAAGQAIRLKPDFQLARNNLAWAVAQKQKRAANGQQR
jgi:tetratricopeptide (TPR) repeat protein